MLSHQTDESQLFVAATATLADAGRHAVQGIERSPHDTCKLMSSWINAITQQREERDTYGCEGTSIRVLRQGEHPLRFSSWHGTQNVVSDLSAMPSGATIWGIMHEEGVYVLTGCIRLLNGNWRTFRYLYSGECFLPDNVWLEEVRRPAETDRSTRRRSRRGRRYS